MTESSSSTTPFLWPLQAELSTQRAQLLRQVMGLDHATLCQVPVFDSRMAKDLLAHVAAWDEIFAGRLRLVIAGREEEIAGFDAQSLAALNEQLHEQRRAWSLEQAVSACLDARSDFLAVLSQIPLPDLRRSLSLPRGEATVIDWTRWRGVHDGVHGSDLAAWRQTLDLPDPGGPRAALLAQLTAERADLLAQLVHLPEETLSSTPVLDDMTVKDLLAHAAAWERWALATLRALHQGQIPDMTAVVDADAFNAAIAVDWRDRSLDAVVAELLEARAAWHVWLAALPEEAFFQEHTIQGEVWSFPSFLEVQWRHDAEHAGQIAAWRKAARPQRQPGPKSVLLAALDVARQSLLAAAAMVPPAARPAEPVHGEWNLKDLLGHIADWELWVLDAVGQMAEGRAPQVAGFDSIQAWNEAHAAARQEQPWQRVWRDFQAGRYALRQLVDGMDQAALERPFPASWAERELPTYAWLTVILLDHDLEHGHDLLGEVSGWHAGR